MSSALSTIKRAVDALPAGREQSDAQRWLGKVQQFEQDTGEALTRILELLETTDAASHTAGQWNQRQRAALASVGADLTPIPYVDRPSTSTAVKYLQLVLDALPTAEAAELLGVSAGRIRQRIGARTLLAVPGSHRGHRLPRFQFTDEGELPGWADVAPRIPAALPVIAVARFMSSPHVDLLIGGESVTPRQWLLDGEQPDRVARLLGD